MQDRESFVNAAIDFAYKFYTRDSSSEGARDIAKMFPENSSNRKRLFDTMVRFNNTDNKAFYNEYGGIPRVISVPWNSDGMWNIRYNPKQIKTMIQQFAINKVFTGMETILKENKELQEKCNNLSDSAFDIVLPYKKLAQKLCSYVI